MSAFASEGKEISIDVLTLNCQLTTSKARYIALRRRWGRTFECRLSLITCTKPPSLDRGHEPCRDEITYRDDHLLSAKNKSLARSEDSARATAEHQAFPVSKRRFTSELDQGFSTSQCYVL